MCFLVSSKLSYGQFSKDAIYDQLDAFVAKPTPKSGLALENATALFEKEATTKDDFLAVVIVNSNLGYYYQNFGTIQERILKYEKAWSIYEIQQLTNYDIFENCLVPLSKLYTQQGDFLKAEELLKRCYLYAESQNDNNLLIQTSLSLSALYNTLGNFNTAIPILEKALKQKPLTTENKELLQNNLATSYVGLKDYSKAKKLLEESIERKEGNHLNSYKNLAFIAIQEKNFELASSYFDRAKNFIKTSENFSARDFISLTIEEAELKLANNKTQEAQETLLSAIKVLLPDFKGKELPSKEQLYAERSFIRIFDVYTATLKDSKAILEVYNLSFYVENLLVQNYVSQDTKIIHQSNHKKRTEKCLQILWESYLRNPNIELIHTAFLYAENSKSAVLQDKIMENNSASSELTSKQRKLSAEREKLLDDVLRIQFKKLGEAEVNKAIAAIQKIDRELNALNATKSASNIDKTIDFKDLHQKIRNDNATLLSYFIGNYSAFLFTADGSEMRMTKLANPQDLETEISNFIRFFDNPATINNNILEFTEAAFKTFELLEIPIKTTGKNIIFIPDGLLNFLPFESLLTQATETSSFAEMPFLVKQYAVAYAYTIYDFLETKNNTDELSILGVFPVFEETPQALNYSIEEAESIQDLFDIQTLFKTDATKANFLEQSKTASLLHLSTHAASGDFIVPAHLQFINDMLYLPELYSLNMTDKTVILSACETGIGKLQSGEGAISVARAFKYAGASKIAFTLWEVNDKSTAQVMAEFYKELKKSESIFQANHQSKLAYLNNPDISNLKKSPYFWNSFVYYGAIEVPVKKSNYLLWVVLALLGLGVVLVLKKSIKY